MITVITTGDQRLFSWNKEIYGDTIPTVGDELQNGSIEYTVTRRVFNNGDVFIYVSPI